MSDRDQSDSAIARILAAIGAGLLRLLGRTWRLRPELPGEGLPDGDSNRALVGAVWHRDLLIAAAAFRDRGVSVPVSRSRDGDLIAAALVHLGYRAPPRGSSSQGGGRALLGLARLVSRGVTVAITTDGPRGPACRSKLGIAMLARVSGVPITPVAFFARPCVRFKSWDRTRLPLPFARVVCRFGAPIAVSRDADPAALEHAVRELDERLAALCAELEAS